MAGVSHSSVKTLAETPHLTSIPPTYNFRCSGDSPVTDPQQEDPIPTVDLSLLTSTDPHQRSEAVRHLGDACREWGFFRVINHGVEERVMMKLIEKCSEFFSMGEEEKKEYQGKHVLDPIRWGTSFNASVENTLLWRDYLKIMVHPHFHSPKNPPLFREALEEYTKEVGKVGLDLVEAISESLGLEACFAHKALNLDSSLQILTANLYPPCPQPELAMGLPPHSDHGLVTMLIQNGVGGLQVHHDGKWVNVDPVPNGLLVNTGDQLEIVSNGEYKSVLHRAVVNGNNMRMSIVLSIGPSMDSIVAPAPELVHRNPAAYTGIKYKDFFHFQQSNSLVGKSCLDRLKNAV